MNSFPLRQLILPAVLVASSVFSVLTLPLVLYKPNSVKLAPFLEGDLEPVFERGNRDLAIRYVGFAIVASVAAGVTTVELKRRSHTQRQTALDALEQPKAAFAEADVFAAPAPVAFDSVDEYFAAAASAAAVPPDSIESDSLEILSAPDRYQTCRIQVPQTDRRFFAILVNGEYYRLFRARKTQEKAIEIAERLRQQGDRVVITKMSEGHALWVWEPQAYLSLG